MSHSPEPWRYIENELHRCIYDFRDNEVVVWRRGRHSQDAVQAVDGPRIVACVNACRGVSTAELEKIAAWKSTIKDSAERQAICWLEGLGYQIDGPSQ